MNDLRTAAQQALDSINELFAAEQSEGGERGGHIRTPATREHLVRVAQARRALHESCDTFRAALAQQAKAETCTWQQDGDSESSLYATSCRRYFSLDDGTPEDNKMAWCCFCGKKLVQEMITEGDDE